MGATVAADMLEWFKREIGGPANGSTCPGPGGEKATQSGRI